MKTTAASVAAASVATTSVATTSVAQAASITTNTAAISMDASPATQASTSTGRTSTTPGPRKNILALKRMAYQQDYIDDEDDFVGTLGHLLPKRPKTVKTTYHDSTLEILDGSFSNLRPIMESSSNVLAHSTPIHRMEIISGNSSNQRVAPTARNDGVSNLKETTRLYKNLATTLNSKRIEEMQSELNQSKTHFGSIRDRISDVLEEMKTDYRKRIEDHEENLQSLRMLIHQMEVVKADREKSIERMRSKLENYDKLRRLILDRLPSARQQAALSDSDDDD